MKQLQVIPEMSRDDDSDKEFGPLSVLGVKILERPGISFRILRPPGPLTGYRISHRGQRVTAGVEKVVFNYGSPLELVPVSSRRSAALNEPHQRSIFCIHDQYYENDLAGAWYNLARENRTSTFLFWLGNPSSNWSDPGKRMLDVWTVNNPNPADLANVALVDMWISIACIAVRDEAFSCTYIGLANAVYRDRSKEDNELSEVMQRVWSWSDTTRNFDDARRASALKRIRFRSLKEWIDSGDWRGVLGEEAVKAWL